MTSNGKRKMGTLNALGPPIKDALKWKPVSLSYYLYKDYNYKIKSELSANIASLNKTGRQEGSVCFL